MCIKNGKNHKSYQLDVVRRYMLTIAKIIPAPILKFISSFKNSTPSSTPTIRFRLTTGTTFDSVDCSSARKKSIVATAAVIPPRILYFIADCSTSNPLLEIKYTPRMTWAMNCEPTKYNEDAIAFPFDDNFMKNCIIPYRNTHAIA